MHFLRRYGSLLMCFLFLVVCIRVVFIENRWRTNDIMHWDVAGYHMYLPAVFIYKDLMHLRFYDSVDAKYRPSPWVSRYGIFQHPETRRSYGKYTAGVAIFQLPAFLIAHAYATVSGNVPADGYSPPYSLAICISSLLFSFLGLLVLRRFLRYYFKDGIVALVVAILGFGTNVLIYSTHDAGMSHVYLFFLYAVVLLYTRHFFDRASAGRAVILGAALGMAVLIRPTDAFLAFIPLSWGLTSVATVRDRINYLWRNKGFILLLIAAAFVPLALQMLYWKATTGHYIWFSYTGEYFIWNRCVLWSGLFSYRKGWFVYTPLALLGFIGFFMMMRKRQWGFYAAPLLLYYTASLYVLFCWICWWYGGSFGCRALLQSLALLALPMGYLAESAFRARMPVKILFSFVVIAGVFLNCFQSVQYSRYIIVDQSMNRAYYWRVFLDMHVTEEDRKLYQ